MGDLGIDLAGLDRERLRRRHQVADIGQEAQIFGLIEALAPILAVPGIDLGLELIAAGQQGGVAGRENRHHLGKPRPERGGIKPGAGEGLGVDELPKGWVDAEGRCHGHAPLIGGVLSVRGIKCKRAAPLRGFCVGAAQQT